MPTRKKSSPTIDKELNTNKDRPGAILAIDIGGTKVKILASGETEPRSEPGNLGPGWVGFDFATAFGKPVRIINDAAMQALGSYEGGRMLFLGLGTGLGSTLISENVIVPLELGDLPYPG